MVTTERISWREKEALEPPRQMRKCVLSSSLPSSKATHVRSFVRTMNIWDWRTDWRLILLSCTCPTGGRELERPSGRVTRCPGEKHGGYVWQTPHENQSACHDSSNLCTVRHLRTLPCLAPFLFLPPPNGWERRREPLSKGARARPPPLPSSKPFFPFQPPRSCHVWSLDIYAMRTRERICEVATNVPLWCHMPGWCSKMSCTSWHHYD